MNLLLAAPMQRIQNQEPSTQQVVFLDGRSWGSPQLPSFARVRTDTPTFSVKKMSIRISSNRDLVLEHDEASAHTVDHLHAL